MLSIYGLPAAVIRMKARRWEREAREIQEQMLVERGDMMQSLFEHLKAMREDGSAQLMDDTLPKAH